MKTDFERQLHAHWQSRDFEAWNQTRGIYADWLGDRMDPLWYFASLPMEGHGVGFSGKRFYLWRLHIPVDRLPLNTFKWKGRVNFRPLLGIPPTCFRMTGFDGDGIDGNRESGPFRLRFTVKFAMRCSNERLSMVPERATRRQLDSLGIYFKFDTNHPLGLAGMVLPSDMRDYADEGLFEEAAT